MRIATTTIAIGLLLSACGASPSEPVGDGPDAAAPASPAAPDDDAPAGTSPPTASPTPSGSADPSPSPDPDDLAVARQPVVDGLTAPLQSLVLDERTLLVQQDGQVLELGRDGRLEPWLDLRSRVEFGGERGLLGADVLAGGEHLVVHYSRRGDGATQLATIPLGPDGPDVDGLTVVYEAAQPASNHNGGSVVVQPDGLVLLALGDGGGANDQFDQAQDTSTPLGAVLRLDLSDPTRAVPAQANPFVGGGGLPEIWLHGLRNPYRIAVGDGQAYVVDVGQDAREELTVVPLDAPGGNLGWPLVEGDRCFAVDPCEDPALVPADVTWRHEDGACSGVTGLVYEGTALPALRGHLLYGDLCQGFLRTARAEGGEVVDAYDLTSQVGTVGGLLATGADADGEALLLFADGRVERLVPAG